MTIPPYFLGCLIGNGCFTKTHTDQGIVSLTTRDIEMIEKISSLGYNYYRIEGKNKVAPSYIYKDERLINALRLLGLINHNAKDKFIPKQYKYSRVESRKELMQGLTDTDGYVDDRGHISYTSISEALINDVAWVAVLEGRLQ